MPFDLGIHRDESHRHRCQFAFAQRREVLLRRDIHRAQYSPPEPITLQYPISPSSGLTTVKISSSYMQFRCEKMIGEWKCKVADVLPEDRIAYVRLPRNVKQPGSATTGLFLARGEFIACQAAHDLSHPTRIEKQVNFLHEHPDVDMVGTTVGTTYEAFNDGDFEHRTVEHAGWLAYGREQIRKSYSNGQHCVCDGTILMRGHVFDRLGGWTRRMKGVSDFEFVGRYVSSGVATENLTDILYYYRVHPGQTTQRLARGEDW